MSPPRSAALAVVLSLLAGAARAEEPASGSPAPLQRAVVTFVLNGVRLGESKVALRGDDILVLESELREAGLHDFHGKREVIEGATYMSLAGVTPQVTWVFDERDIALRIEAPAEILPQHVISFRARPTGIEYPRDASLFLNYAPRVIDFRELTGTLELAGSERGVLYSTTAFGSTQAGFVRGLTSVVIDDRDRMNRLTFGDSFISSTALGGSIFAIGVAYTRAFGIDPYFIRSPSLTHSGSALTPSTVDVYVNGVRMRREELAPGTFRINDLQPPAGAGMVTYVIKDAFGREQRMSTPYYVSPGVLAPGVSDFAYQMGFRREGLGTSSLGYREPEILLRHRVGLPLGMAVGGRFEVRPSMVSLGPTLSKATPIGQIDFEIATSFANRDAAGAAVSLAYGYISRRIGTGVTVRASTNDYANLALRPEQDRPSADASLYATVPLGTHGGAAFLASATRMRDTGDLTRLTVTGNYQIGLDAILLVTASRTQTYDSKVSYEAFATLSFLLGIGATASGGAGGGSAGPTSTVGLTKALPVSTGYGYAVTSTFGALPRTLATAQYQTTFGRYDATYSYFDGGEHLSLSAAGSLVLVPKAGLFASLPVSDAFGIIRVPGVAGVRATVNNHEVGRTDARGNVVVPNLLSYYGNRLGIVEQDIPLDYTLGKTERIIAPPFRGAAIAEFQVSKKHYYRGEVRVVRAGRDVVPENGMLTIMGKKDGKEAASSPLNATGAFELEGLAVGAYDAEVEDADGKCAFRVDIPDGDKVVIDLQVIRCVAH